MKAKGIVTAVLLSATSFAWAQGGLGIDNVEQHMNAENWINTQSSQSEFAVQGSLDKFQVELPDSKRTIADTNKLKQGYDGRV